MKTKIVLLIAALAAQQNIHACIVSYLTSCGGGTLSQSITETDGSHYTISCYASPGQIIATAYNCVGLDGDISATILCRTSCVATRYDAGFYGVEVTISSAVPTLTHSASGNACDDHCGA